MTQAVSYSLLDPTGNVTILVESPIAESEQARLAQQLMLLEPDAEQVGFVTQADDGVFLRMAGGEFCGNATMSAALLYLLRNGRPEEMVTVHVCGTPEPIAVNVDAIAEGIWRGTVKMPSPLAIDYECFPGGERLPVVRFPGISHVILENNLETDKAEQLASEWCRYLEADALGLMFLNQSQGRLKPLVYVPAADTLFWESSCASGTTAVGAYLAAKENRAVSISLEQPGGRLEIQAQPEGALYLSGTLQIRKNGVEAFPD